MFLTFIVAQMGEDKTNEQTTKKKSWPKVILNNNKKKYLKKKKGINSSKEALIHNYDYRRSKSVMLK